METFKNLIIFSITVAVTHLTTAQPFADMLIEKAELYYMRPADSGEPSRIRLEEVEDFQYNNLVFYIHGYIANPDHDSVAPVKDGLLAAGGYDVIAADWSLAAKLPYPEARAIVGAVGTFFHKKISEILTKHDIDFADVTCVGHSLGAHVCGGMGNATDGRLGKIIGLDPAKPLISVDAPDCLRSTNAKRVHNIHTAYPVLGHLTPLGHADFYPHFGVLSQPGCLDLAMWTDFITKGNGCSHNRASQILGESAISEFNFLALRCAFAAIQNKSVSECLMGQETSSPSLHNDDIVFFGMNIPESVKGTFIFDTNARPPFGKGANAGIPKGYGGTN